MVEEISIPDDIDRATLLPRFKAFMEHFFFQGFYLDEAGRATLASVTPAERAWFTNVLSEACAHGSARTPIAGVDPLRLALPWLDEPAYLRLSGAIAWATR